MEHEPDQTGDERIDVDPADPMEGRRFHPTGGQVPTGDTTVDPRTPADELTDDLVDPDVRRLDAGGEPDERGASPSRTRR